LPLQTSAPSRKLATSQLELDARSNILQSPPTIDKRGSFHPERLVSTN
jgi:hypothetical protein